MSVEQVRACRFEAKKSWNKLVQYLVAHPNAAISGLTLLYPLIPFVTGFIVYNPLSWRDEPPSRDRSTNSRGEPNVSPARLTALFSNQHFRNPGDLNLQRSVTPTFK